MRSCDTVPGRETLDFRLVFKSLTFVALFAFGCCACVFAYAQGAEPERLAPRASISEKVEEARLLVAIGHFDEVRSMLRAYREAGSTDADLLFVLGLASAGKVQHVQVQEPERQALLDEAVAAFRAVLAARPGYVRARIELATTFFLIKDDLAARKHFEQALAEELPSWVAENIRLFLARMDARKR